MKEKELNKLYWTRVVLAAVAGVLSGFLYVHSMWSYSLVMPLIFYVASFYVYASKNMIRVIGKSKAGYHGLGSYIITWIAIYMLTVTVLLA